MTTGVGAAPGAVIAAGGAATAAVGGGVSAVGAGADSAATALDSAAQWAKTGKAPDLVSQLLAQGQRILTNLVLKKVPGVGAAGKTATQANGKGGGHIKGCKHLEKGPPRRKIARRKPPKSKRGQQATLKRISSYSAKKRKPISRA